ncbi:MAG: ABC transporter ATP-binding protein [Candidatus Latescibacterota bacterium]|jgi:branched-chain amino acid transport system ATP-binding protein
MLNVRNLESGYGQLRVLKGVSLHVRPREIVTLIGANGAGKTTLLGTIAGILPLISGEILYAGESSRGLRPEQLACRGCALVPEGRQVFGPMTVEENLLLGAHPLFRRRERAAIGDGMTEVFALFPRLAERRGQLAGTLSGGEQQMLAIGRALMGRPRLIMLDEPSMGLAPLVVKDILRTIAALRERGNTVLLVEQNARAALAIADRGYVLETGQIMLEGSAAELLANNEVRRAYLGKEYRSIDE